MGENEPTYGEHDKQGGECKANRHGMHRALKVFAGGNVAHGLPGPSEPLRHQVTLLR